MRLHDCLSFAFGDLSGAYATSHPITASSPGAPNGQFMDERFNYGHKINTIDARSLLVLSPRGQILSFLLCLEGNTTK